MATGNRKHQACNLIGTTHHHYKEPMIKSYHSTMNLKIQELWYVKTSLLNSMCRTSIVLITYLIACSQQSIEAIECLSVLP